MWHQIKSRVRSENTPMLNASGRISITIVNIPTVSWKKLNNHVIKNEYSYPNANITSNPLVLDLNEEDESDTEIIIEYTLINISVNNTNSLHCLYQIFSSTISYLNFYFIYFTIINYNIIEM